MTKYLTSASHRKMKVDDSATSLYGAQPKKQTQKNMTQPSEDDNAEDGITSPAGSSSNEDSESDISDITVSDTDVDFSGWEDSDDD